MIQTRTQRVTHITPPPPQLPGPPAHLPTSVELLKTPIRPNDRFQFIPTPCIHSTVLLFIRIIRAAAASCTPTDVHNALLQLHMFPTVVLRKSFRGERGWRSSIGQMHAMRQRITRAGRGEWGELWREALNAHSAREEWYRQQIPSPRKGSSRSRRTARTLMLASQAQYTRTMRAMKNTPNTDLTDRNTLVALENLHPAPTQPIKAIDETDFPPPPRLTSPPFSGQ